MGTSTRQPSPPTLGWQAVAQAYTSPNIPMERVLAEIWRASQSQVDPVIPDLMSPLVFACQQRLHEAALPSDLAATLNRLFAASKANSFIAELAKRAAVSVAGRPDAPSAWRQHFFSQVTDYLASRDLSGHVGPRFRNETVSQVIEFKRTISDHVRATIGALELPEPRTITSWRQYVRQAVRTLAEGRR